jgi:hypothetical protein
MPKSSDPDRVRANTADEINRLIDRGIADSVAYYSGKGKDEIRYRIAELEREWDIERLLETNASALAFTGLLLGITRSKKWLLLPAIVLPFLFQHAVQGWCPPVPIFRRWGVRTREEIDREKYALKALRGDFENVGSNPENADQAAKA